MPSRPMRPCTERVTMAGDGSELMLCRRLLTDLFLRR